MNLIIQNIRLTICYKAVDFIQKTINFILEIIFSINQKHPYIIYITVTRYLYLKIQIKTQILLVLLNYMNVSMQC